MVYAPAGQRKSAGDDAGELDWEQGSPVVERLNWLGTPRFRASLATEQGGPLVGVGWRARAGPAPPPSPAWSVHPDTLRPSTAAMWPAKPGLAITERGEGVFERSEVGQGAQMPSCQRVTRPDLFHERRGEVLERPGSAGDPVIALPQLWRHAMMSWPCQTRTTRGRPAVALFSHCPGNQESSCARPTTGGALWTRLLGALAHDDAFARRVSILLSSHAAPPGGSDPGTFASCSVRATDVMLTFPPACRRNRGARRASQARSDELGSASGGQYTRRPSPSHPPRRQALLETWCGYCVALASLVLIA